MLQLSDVMPENPASAGKTLTEYLLVGALIALVGVGALSMLGNSVSQVLGNVSGNTMSNYTNTVFKPVSSSSAVKTPTLQTINTQTATSFTMGTNFPKNAIDMIETAGANGATTLYMGQLEKVIQQLKDQGLIDELQVGDLSKLANKGHQIAEIERLLENHMDKYGHDPALYQDTLISYNGKEYKAWELSNSIGYSSYANGGETLVGNHLAEFLALKEAAAASGALNDPASYELVSALVNQTAYMANGLESASINIYMGKIDSGEANKIMKDAMKREEDIPGMSGSTDLTSLISEKTDENSETICTTGGGEDNGRSCK